MGSTKAGLRREVLAARRSAPWDRAASCRALLPHLAGMRRVAAYWALADEPSAAPLLASFEVFLPRLLESGDLDLVPYAGELAPGRRGTQEPRGPAVPWASVDAVVAPALAVDAQGVRLGRGGGSYDRALAGVGVPVIALLALETEWVGELPAEPHDVRVAGAALPGGVRFAEGRDGFARSTYH